MSPTKGLVLVTGASGFLASHCVHTLLESGYSVRGSVRSTTGAKVQHLLGMGPNVELVAADLMSDEGWEAAARGCDYCLHVASPFVLVTEQDAAKVVEPAVQGTLRVLRACAASGTMKRVVLTSSTAAIASGWESPPANGDRIEEPEKRWSVPEKSLPYPRSKTLAERAAWDFVAEERGRAGACFELAVINPGFLVGPSLSTNPATSFDIATKLLTRQMPAVPALALPTVDVRDAALAHVAAMTVPGAAGERFACVAETLWLRDMALAAAEALGPLGYRVPTMALPNLLARVVALFDPMLRAIVPELGVAVHLDCAESRRVLGLRYRDARAGFVDMCRSLVALGMVASTPKFREWQQQQQQQQQGAAVPAAVEA